MNRTYSLTPTITLFHADCREALRVLPDNCIDSVPCDPPYAIGFMGKAWDVADVANDAAFWREVFRVLKPGGHVAAFGASRGYHRMAVAIEDAGFEIRDSLMWLYGTGFPKSQNVAIAIDKQSGAIGHRSKRFNTAGDGAATIERQELRSDHPDFEPYAPATLAAREWEGFGTALKPAFEPIVLARKPLSEGTVAANVLRWRTGALNIDGCRVHTEGESTAREYVAKRTVPGATQNATGERHSEDLEFVGSSKEGRWPANVVTDGSDEVVGCFPGARAAYGNTDSAERNAGKDCAGNEIYGKRKGIVGLSYADSGSAARFFYSAKASKGDRAGSKHPTVKPIALIAWLARLITPPGGTVLDPFAGSGTTGAAAAAEGFNAVLCEREPEYVQDILRRFGHLPHVEAPSISA